MALKDLTRYGHSVGDLDSIVFAASAPDPDSDDPFDIIVDVAFRGGGVIRLRGNTAKEVWAAIETVHPIEEGELGTFLAKHGKSPKTSQ